jgi:hypothetical protein
MGRLEKVLKYKTALMLAVAMRQTELPESIPLLEGDRSDYLLGGSLGKCLKRLLVQRAGRHETVRLFQDLFFAKRGSLPVDDRFVRDALEKHFRTLTEHPDVEAEDGSTGSVKRTVMEVYSPGNRRGRRSVSWTPGKGKVPTFGSCVENPRKEAGAFGYLVESLGLYPAEGYLYGYARYGLNITEVRVPDPDWELTVDEWASIARRGVETRIECRPVALLEPFKVRVITRGEAHCYHLCRRYQPRIHHEMASQEPFRLTQGPLMADDIDRLLVKAGRFNHTHGGFWVSGDYEAATDGLHPDLSEACMQEICRSLNIDFVDQQLLIHALTGHRIVWVGDGDLDGGGLWVDPEGRSSKDQNWGQLMGSPVSFPVLCLVNAAITRMWFEREMGFRIKLREMPLLVNGDDILFWCPSVEAYARWKETVSRAGLKPSVGKNYTSDSFLVINSQIWSVKRSIDFFGQEIWVNTGLLPSMNLGLLFGTTKSESSHSMEKALFGSHEAQRDSLNLRAHDWVAGYPEDQDMMMSVFIQYWKSTLKSVPKEVSWWVHPSYGGLGLPVTREVEITDRQRKLAAYLHLAPIINDRRVQLRGIAQPLPGFSECFMRNWSGVLDRLGVKPVREGRYPVPEGWSLLRYHLRTGYDPTDPEGYSAYRRCYEKLWKASLKHWAKPLSFRKCVQGSDREVGIPWRITVG